MKRFLLVLAGALMLTLFGAVSASANGGPHGGYTSSGGTTGGLPDQCAACHRVHQGQSVGKLLKASSQYALCLTCHNGAGSRLDVLDGVKLGAYESAYTNEQNGIIRQADTDKITVAAFPDAVISVGKNATNSISILIRNRSTTPITVIFAVSNPVNASFGASSVSPTSITLTGTVSGIPTIGYVRLTTVSTAAVADGATNLTTIGANDGTATATVAVLTRVDATSDIGTDGVPSAQYASNTLNGGGFRYINGMTVTSRHNADPADNTLQPWGYQTNSGLKSGTLDSPLQCTSCHNPHGTANYRLLKTSLNGASPVVRAFYCDYAASSTCATAGAITGANASFMADEGGPGIASTPNFPNGWQPADKYTREYYGSAAGDGGFTNGAPTTAGKGSIASLCGACHNAYPSGGASVAYNAGGVTHYRHKTEMSYLDWSNPDPSIVSLRLSPERQAGQTNTNVSLAGFPKLRLASAGTYNPGSGNVTVIDEVVTCLTCHRVHGSASSMSGYALTARFGGKGDNDLTPSQLVDETMPNGRSDSTLLYTDNRGMCQACHQW